MTTTKELQMKKTSELIPYVNNARTHSEEQVLKLRASLREFGFINPILIDRDNTVLAGHGRLMALKQLGWKEVPIIILHGLTEDKKKALLIADNKIARNLFIESFDWLDCSVFIVFEFAYLEASEPCLSA